MNPFLSVFFAANSDAVAAFVPLVVVVAVVRPARQHVAVAEVFVLQLAVQLVAVILFDPMAFDVFLVVSEASVQLLSVQCLPVS